jgi:hypothetical protein
MSIKGFLVILCLFSLTFTTMANDEMNQEQMKDIDLLLKDDYLYSHHLPLLIKRQLRNSKYHIKCDNDDDDCSLFELKTSDNVRLIVFLFFLNYFKLI